MRRIVSSGNLASRYIELKGSLPKEYTVVANHTDCDSVISTLLMGDIINPHQELNAAVIAADHTGEENLIADLLQGLDKLRDFNFSVSELLKLLSGQELSPVSLSAIQRRQDVRNELKTILSNPEHLTFYGNVALIQSPISINAELVTPLLADAVAIIILEPRNPMDVTNDSPNVYVSRIRLGLKGMELGLNLHNLQINDGVSPHWGGRWNAGSDNRGGGFPNDKDPLQSATLLNKRIRQELLKAF